MKIYIKPHKLKFHFRKDDLVIDKRVLEYQWNCLLDVRTGIIKLYTRETNPRKREVLWDIISRQSDELLKLKDMIDQVD